MADDAAQPGWKKAIDSLWVRLPELVLAVIGGIGWVVFSLWVTVGNHSDRLFHVYEYIETDKHHMEKLADCVKRAECEAVRALINAHELRLTKVETNFTSHEALARERIERIQDLERSMRELSTQPGARPDQFTGSEGRVLRERIDSLQQQVKDLKN